MKKKSTGEIVDKWIKINYDYVPKYCKNCKLQGHNEQDCYVIHPELYPKKEEQCSDKEQEVNSKADQRKNKEQKNTKNSRLDIKEYKGTNLGIMKGKEIADKVQPAEGNDDDGFKEKKGKQSNNRHFHRSKYDENAWKPNENQTLQNNQYAALQNTNEEIIDVTDVQKSSNVEAKMPDASDQIITMQQIVDNNDKVNEKQMEKAKEKQIDELKKVEKILAKEWFEKNFGKQLNDKGEIISQQVSKVTSGTISQEKEHDVLQEQEKEHEVLQGDVSQEYSDILINKNMEEQNMCGDVLQEDDDHEGTPLEEVENSQHGKHEEIQVQADIDCQDEEDLSQNIDDIAQEADLSPRSVQKLKQATNKQKPVRSNSNPVAGVSTRRSKNKINNYQ
ncbi:uncharacterized protein LOC132610188 [Lycium barbarum]|uniref:uncharacterized protein LOC132610188 n=1 Tax=Lycium barbarum TaxID=112863 RepID=UPI00293F59D8|nr:uncharacterized protein LOC132610188 [Lycium barbarum]